MSILPEYYSTVKPLITNKTYFDIEIEKLFINNLIAIFIVSNVNLYNNCIGIWT